MGTELSASEVNPSGFIVSDNLAEALFKDGHQNWHRLVLHDFNVGDQFEAVIHKYETWSEPSEVQEPAFRGLRGQGDIEENRARGARRAKKKIRHACKSAKFDRMLTLTSRDAIFDRSIFQRMIEKFIRLTRKASGDAMPYVLTVEKHDSAKTSEAKRGSLHAHIAVRGRQDYKLLQSIWNYRVCGGNGFVRVSNGSKKMSASSIASYISKYIGKSFNKPVGEVRAVFSVEEYQVQKKAADKREKAGEPRYPLDPDANKKSYWISHNIAAPARTVKLFRTASEALSWIVDFFVSKGVRWGFDKWHCWQDPALGVIWLSAG
ncbi:MAG: hypothetical protein WA435_03520 [Gallionellaceae bacterium]